MPNEKKRPSPIAEALKGYLEKSGLSERLERTSILEDWAQVVGPQVASVTKAVTVGADGTLFVAVRSSSWMAELTMMEREILAAINARSERGQIAKIRWHISR